MTQIEDVQPFYDTEPEHQEFYKFHPERMAEEEAAGRADFVKKYWENNTKIK